MSEKPIRRDQENIHFDARSPLASQVPHHRRDIRLFENRILQETPQTSHPNAYLLKSQGRNQEYTTSPNNAIQLEKTNGDKIFQKASDNELRQILKESTSPAASAGINDISYRIVNEILNTQGEGRSHLKTKQAGRLAERKKNPLVTGQLSEIENVVETPKESKLVFEENEELKRLEKKIFDTKRQLDTRKGLVENGKVKLETEPKSLEEREQKLREDIVIVKQRIEDRARVKSQTKEKPNMNPAKERLRQLKSELQHYEKELSNLKRHIEKQEKDWNEIEESVMENYRTQIQEFEEAIMSIEEQKMGIYEKLNEAARAHNENLEQKAMLKEDLSSRLLQRADLVGQREELEQAIESFRRNNRVEVEFCYFEKQTKQEIAPLDSDIQDLQIKAQSLKQQLEALNKANERDIDKEARVMHLQLLKNSWRDLCLFEVDLSNKADTFGLPSLVECYSNVLDTYEVQFNDPQQLWDYMQDVLEQEEDDETLIEELQMRENIRKETLDIWANQIADMLGKAGENDEEREVIIMYERYCELINHLDEIFEKKDKLKNEENQSEEYKEINLFFKQVQDELRDKELQREELKRKIEQKRDELEIDCEREAEVAFQAYVEQHSSVFELIQNESGVEVADIARQEHHQEFIQIARDNLADRLEHFREMQEEVKHLEQIIKSNTEIVDLKVLPLIQDLLPTLEEGAVLNSALKQQQMLLLETEDEVSGQLDLVLESRNDQLQQLYDKYISSLMHSTSELREARDMLESKCKVLNEEASHLENSIMEVDKLATEELFEERKLQKELRDIEVELHNIETVQKPSLHALPVKLEVWDKEIKELEKVMEKLEMQRLGLEQQFIEQNYLGEEVSYHSNTSASMANEKSGKILNYESKESKNSEIQGSAANSFVKGLKNRDIQGLTDIEAIAPENFDLSPIGRTSMSPKHRRNNKEQNLFVEGNAISSQPESTIGKDHLSNWNCFSPPNSALLLGSGKGKGKTSGSKEKRRGGAEDGRKEESSYLKNYQKRREQKQNAGRHELPRSSTSVSLDTRTRSLPQTSIPNANYNPISKRIEDAGFFTQHTSPKVNETLNRPPSGQNSRDFNSTQNLDKRYFSKELGDSGRRMPNNGLELEEGTNIFTPKELNLHIDSLKAQAHPYAAMKSMPQEDLRYKELIGRNGELPGEDLAREFFVEGDDTEAMYSNQGKPLSVETSVHSTEIGGRFSGKGPKCGVEAEMTTKRIYQNLHGIMGAVRRGLVDSEETGSQEDISRSKSTGVQGRLNVRFGAHVSDKLSSRDREERSQGKLETVASRGNTDFLRSLGSPLGRTGGKNYDYREALNDLKGRTIGGDHTIHEAVFFETVKPLLQGSLVYKKFTNYQSLKRAEFDPLMGDLYPPEVCGYGVRSLKLHPNLDRIEVKHTSKASVELSIPIESILRAVVPQITMDILRVQKRIVESQHISGHFDDKISIADIFGDISTKALLAKRGVNSLNNGMERYLNCSYYSFSILLEKNGKVEFVTSRYNTFKEWIHGINVLLKHKKQLSKLKDKLDKF